ncbi:hypothetical protein PsorP6_013642 [Peronosclerospora sorghi]|uniref:Uncharacterized protein n=1 Tax=Peronosclerospora sorghi TaxID=230839 RepID=A0ACC0VG56_9STRA|nr:hypothetical protein PsorP6_013642 [Peronosclerospora sorghi]
MRFESSHGLLSRHLRVHLASSVSTAKSPTLAALVAPMETSSFTTWEKASQAGNSKANHTILPR